MRVGCWIIKPPETKLTNLIGAWHAIGATLQGGPDEDLLAHP